MVSGPISLQELNWTAPSYNAWLHWETYSPCNFRCAYCTSVKNPARPIDIDALLRTLDETGYTFRMSFTGGGEPFLVPNLVETCRALAEKHYVSLNTHLTAPQIARFIDQISPNRVLSLCASAHLEELDRLNLFDTFADNYLAAKSKGFPVKCLAVAYPPLAGRADSYRERFASRGIDLVFTPFIGRFEGVRYPASYTDEQLSAFRVSRVTADRHLLQGGICNAGYNTAVASPEGDVYGCANARYEAVGRFWRNYRLKLGNLYTGFRFRSKLIECPYPVCTMPMNCNDPRLFQIATSEAGILNP